MNSICLCNILTMENRHHSVRVNVKHHGRQAKVEIGPDHSGIVADPEEDGAQDGRGEYVVNGLHDQGGPVPLHLQEHPAQQHGELCPEGRGELEVVFRDLGALLVRRLGGADDFALLLLQHLAVATGPGQDLRVAVLRVHQLQN